MTNTEDDDRVMALAEEIERLRDENQRLRAEIDQNRIDLEEYRRKVGALDEALCCLLGLLAGQVEEEAPDQKAVDADLLREEAHERNRLPSGNARGRGW